MRVILLPRARYVVVMKADTLRDAAVSVAAASRQDMLRDMRAYER